MADGETGPHGLHLIEDGPWKGWATWIGGDPFEDHCGPYYFRQEADGVIRCAFRAEQKHMNGSGNMHGGALLTFADYVLFVAGSAALSGSRSVTVSLNGEFVGPVALGDLVEATAEVVRAGSSLVFMRGLITTGGAAVMTFSGVVKKIKPRN